MTKRGNTPQGSDQEFQYSIVPNCQYPNPSPNLLGMDSFPRHAGLLPGKSGGGGARMFIWQVCSTKLKVGLTKYCHQSFFHSCLGKVSLRSFFTKSPFPVGNHLKEQGGSTNEKTTTTIKNNKDTNMIKNNMTNPFTAVSQNGGNLLSELGEGRSEARFRQPAVAHHSVTESLIY